MAGRRPGPVREREWCMGKLTAVTQVALCPVQGAKRGRTTDAAPKKSNTKKKIKWARKTLRNETGNKRARRSGSRRKKSGRHGKR